MSIEIQTYVDNIGVMLSDKRQHVEIFIPVSELPRVIDLLRQILQDADEASKE